jgi:1-acyl-sn-glycerol-3-phosphate acyltransferase
MKLSFGVRVMRMLFGFIFRTFTKLEIEGWENIPAEGPCIIAVNHLHLFDVPIVYGLLGDRKTFGFVAAKHRNSILARWVVRTSNSIWLDNRSEVLDRAAIAGAIERLNDGYFMGIAPEGTRSRSAQLLPAKPGVSFLVSQTKSPVLPLAHWGTENIIQQWKRFKRPVVRLRIGRPFDLTEIPVLDRKKRYEVWTDELMCRLAALLPEPYRGAYTTHPRTQEILRDINSIL